MKLLRLSAVTCKAPGAQIDHPRAPVVNFNERTTFSTRKGVVVDLTYNQIELMKIRAAQKRKNQKPA